MSLLPLQVILTIPKSYRALPAELGDRKQKFSYNMQLREQFKKTKQSKARNIQVFSLFSSVSSLFLRKKEKLIPFFPPFH